MKERNATAEPLMSFDEVVEFFDGAEVTAADDDDGKSAAEREREVEAIRQYREMTRAGQSLVDRHHEVYERIQKGGVKRTFFLMQCLDCQMFWLGSSGAKGWKFPSARSGSCSVCTAGLVSTEISKHRDERTRVIRQFQRSEQGSES